MSSSADELREEVRRRYADSARAVSEHGDGCGCGGGSCCVDDDEVGDMFGQALYDAEERGELPREGRACVARLWQSDGGGGTA